MQIKVDKKVVKELSSMKVKCLLNDLLDIGDWTAAAIEGKANKCMKRMVKEWIPKLRAKNLSIPADNTELIDLILAQDDYKNRTEREAENEELI